MNTQSPINCYSSRKMRFVLRILIAAGITLGLMLLLGNALLVSADPAAIYVRTDGNDSACNGEYDAPASAAPNCAVASIEQGINLVSASGTVNVRSGAFTENICVDKPLNLIGSQPVTLTSRIGLNQTLITVEADNVTIDGFTLIVNRPSATAGIDARERDGLTVRNCIIQDTGSRGWFANPYLFTNVVGIAVLSDDDTAESVTISNTQITLDSGAYSYYNRAIWLRKVHGQVLSNELFALEQDALLQYPMGGETKIEGNSFLGAGLDIKEPATGPVTVYNNTFAPTSDSFSQSLLIKHNYNPVAVNVISNTFTGHRVGILSGASRDVTVHNNIFIPAPGATIFTHTQINTAYPSSSGQDPLGGANSITLTNNIFQNSTATGLHGTAIEIMNDNSKDAVDYNAITIGGSQEGVNTFMPSLKRTVWLKANVTRTNPDINAFWNNWGYSTVHDIEPTTYHQPDNTNLAKIDYYSMTLAALPTSLWADGKATVYITTAITGFVTPGAGDIISFTSGIGTVYPQSATADANGHATASLTSTVAGATTLTVTGGGSTNNTEIATATINFAPVTDLVLTKSDGLATTTPGGILAYLITITNTGYHTAYSVTVTDTLPAQTTFVTASDGGTETSPGSDQIVWPPFTIYPGSANRVTRLIVVTVDNPLPAGVDVITNVARVTDELDYNPANDVGYDTNVVDAAPDLSVIKSDGNITALPGQTISYQLVYANVGNQTATGVVLAETVPARTTFNAAVSDPAWNCPANAPGGTLCTLNVGDLAVNGNHTATFAATIINPLPSGVTHITNTTTIADDNTNGRDPNIGNNTSTESTPVVAAPDLTILKDDGAINASPDQTVVYTLTYNNLGNQIASGVIVTDAVPLYTTFDAGASTPGWTCADGAPGGTACTFALGEVGSAGTLIFAAKIDSSLPAGVSEVHNVVYIADNGVNGADNNPANNADTERTPVGAAADLAASKTDGRSTAYPDQHLKYVISITNQGVQGASNVRITDTLPAHVTFSSATDGGIETPQAAGSSSGPSLASSKAATRSRGHSTSTRTAPSPPAPHTSPTPCPSLTMAPTAWMQTRRTT